MTKLLIIGKDSCIGKNLKNHFLNRSRGFIVNAISVRNDDWKEINFQIYDCIVYLAAAKPEHENADSEVLNYWLNCDMPFEIARAAKAAGVSRFVFPSTIDVYGKTPALGSHTTIQKDTPLAPDSLYAKSKLAGEEKLHTLEDDTFQAIILRLPLVYGPGCPGEYETLTELLLSGEKFPAIKNELSAINISTLCAFLQYLIEYDYSGTFHPQNRNYVSTLELLEGLSKDLLAPFSPSKWMGFKYRLFKKSCPEKYSRLLGTLVYSKDIDL